MRRLRLLAVQVAVLVLTAACGGGGDGGGADDASLRGQTVEVAAVWTGEEQANLEKVLVRFEQRTGVTVSTTSTGDDIATVLGTRIQGGSPPDIAILPQPGLLADLANRGALKPLEDDVADLVDENYSPVWRELGTVKDTLYGVWVKAANKSTVWYNAGAFRDAGVEPPTTWAQFLERARTIANSGVTPVSVAGGDGWTLTDWFENVYLRVAGPEKYDQLANHEIPWTDESVKRALSRLGELWGDRALIVDGALGTSFPQSVTQVFSAPPKGAIVYEGDFVASVIAEETTAELGDDARFFEFPSIDGSPESIVGGGDVAVRLTDEPAAKALMEYLATAEFGESWAALGGFTSPNDDVDLDRYPNETARQSAQALVEAEIFRFDLSDLQPSAFGGTPSQGMWKILQDFLANPSDVDGTAQRLEAAADSAFDR